MKLFLLKHFPVLYKTRVLQLRLKRHLHGLSPSVRFAKTRSDSALEYIFKKHKSILRRKLGALDPQLQENKIVNLGISIGKIDGIIVKPGETFSFWKLVGKPDVRAGYLEGLMLSYGEVKAGVGGGLCQLANMLFWLALHTPLAIKERHHHSFDIFPDERRVNPFGSGTSIFFNYLDLQFYNGSDQDFQFRVWLTDEFLEGAVYSSAGMDNLIRIEERNHRFFERDGQWFRENEIWKVMMHKENKAVLWEERIIRNFAEVKYKLN